MNLKILANAAAALFIANAASAQYSWQSAFPSLPSFALPIELIAAHDGTNRFFLVQQAGVIYAFQNTPVVSTRKVFLNISDRVTQPQPNDETGLLGLAFHPHFPDSNYFYVNYTSSSSGTLRSYVTRYSVSPTNPDSALHASEKILFTVDQPFANHNGGKLAFGPDGYLYCGFGDGGSGNDPGNRAQDRTTLLGKILRIDVDRADSGLQYAIPPTNPYYHNSLGYRQEIYAYGIRNPWKFSFDPLTGWLWLGDVGQGAREEVDLVVNGGNYGWRLMEGFICTPVVNPTCQDTAGLLPPIWDYTHDGADAAITGGYVYRGSEIPALSGRYIFGDYGSGRTRALTYDGIHPASAVLLSDESYQISAFGADTGGNVYLCSYGNSGRIYRLISSSSIVPSTPAIPRLYQLYQNFPNPFNPSTTIEYDLSERSIVRLTVEDVLGRQVGLLVDGTVEAGRHEAQFTAPGLASGVYFYRLQAADQTIVRMMVLQK